MSGLRLCKLLAILSIMFPVGGSAERGGWPKDSTRLNQTGILTESPTSDANKRGIRLAITREVGK